MTVTHAAYTSPDLQAPSPANATGEQKCLDVAFLTQEERGHRGQAALPPPASPGTGSVLQGCDGQSLGAKLGEKGNSHSGLSC